MISNHLRIVTFFIALLASCICVHGQNVGIAERFPKELKPCVPEGVQEQLLCGKFTVFENRETKRGRTLDLNIIVLPSTNGSPIYPPLFDLDGGPGIPDTHAAGFYANEGKTYRVGRDIVLIDQRGTGSSNPLNCPQSTSPTTPLDEMYPVEYVKNCRRELEKRADLLQYTTEIAMDDLDAIRGWLGYPKIDLSALSYGTRAAQVYIRRHPNSIDRAILIGAIGTYHKMPFYHAPNGQRSLDLLLDECVSDLECNKAFPNIKSEMIEVISQLLRHAKTVQYPDATTSKVRDVVIRGDIFAEKLRNSLYSRETSQDIPLLIHRASQGDFKPFLDRFLSKPGLSLSDGLYLSITCAEDVPFIRETEAAKLSKPTIFGEYRVFQQKRACKNWPRARLSSDFLKPVTSAAPLLIISGNFDPVTPPNWGAEIVKGFKNGRQIVFPELAHSPDGLSHFDCLDGVILAFLSGTAVEKLDASCAAEMKPHKFLITPANSN